MLPRLLIAILTVCKTVSAQGPPQSEDANVKGTNILDHDAPIAKFYGKTFLKQNIPYIDIPDSNIQEVYYYRWSSIQRHLRYINAGTGYMQTEFVQPVSYAQAFGSIDAAAGHQIDEAKWLRSRYLDDDLISLYARGPGNSTQYTQWITDSAYRRSFLTGDYEFTNGQLDDYVRMYNLWNYTFDEDPGLYYFTTEWDAQEYSLPGYVMPNPVTHPDSPQYGGPNTYRPSLNAYMYGNAIAIQNIAEQVGNQAVANQFHTIASNLETAIYKYLWNETQQFFVDVIKPDNPTFAGIDGREEVGFYPYRFGLGLSANYTNPAIGQLFDPDGFYAMYGPTTLERRNQFFNATVQPCCHWNGMSWPFSTAHTLKAMAMMYRSGQSNLTVDQYYDYITRYAATQHKNGTGPYVAEAHYPDMDSWSYDSTNHSEDYDHSTFCDDVLSGLLGVLPQQDDTFVLSPIIPSNWTYFAIENLPYKSHLISVFYDSSNSSNRYKQTCNGCLTIYVDGDVAFQQAVTSPSANITLSGPSTAFSNTPVPINIAANPDGIDEQKTWPRATATYTWYLDSPWKAIDGALFYDPTPDNRWSNYNTTSDNDTLTITFPRPHTFTSITLAIYTDVGTGGTVDVPSSIELSGDNTTGHIATISSGFVANDKNTFTFNESVTSNQINVLFVRQPDKAVGVCELEIWIPPQTPGPNTTYYAVDGYSKDLITVPTDSSNATSAQPYVTGFGGDGTLLFSGVMLANGAAKQAATLTVLYQNPSPATVVNVNVNAIENATQISLTQSSSTNISSITTKVNLENGKNFITLSGGTNDLRIFGIQVA